jgi:Family of unknown function (DUF6941)
MLGGMEMTFAFFADSASIPPDGKVYVLGGGFSNMIFPELPARANFAVVGGFRFNSADLAASHTVELRLVDADGKLVVAPATLQFQLAGTPPQGATSVSLPTVTFLSPTFAQPGTYLAEFWHEGRLLSSAELSVEERKVPAPSDRPN